MTRNKLKILIGVSAAAFLGPFTQTVYTPSLPALQGFFGVNTVLVNLTISLYSVVFALGNLFVGPLADRWGRRTLLFPGLTVFCLGSLVCLFSSSYWLFLAGRLLQGLGASAGSVVAGAVVADIYAPHERARAMGVYQTVVYLGPVFGPVAGGLIAAYLHWQWAFALLAVVAALLWAYNRSRLPETLPRDLVPIRITWHTFRGVLAKPAAAAILLVGFSQFYGYYVFLVFLPGLLSSLLAQSTASLGFFFLPLTVGILLGISIGRHWQKRWTRTRITVTCSFGISATVFLLWLALAAHALSVPLLVALLAAYGVLLGASLPVQTTILVNQFQQEKATALGIYNLARFSGAAAGPVAGGLIELRYGAAAVFLSLALLLFLAAAVIRRNLSDPYEISPETS
ncbi:MAG TPA: MFS transporter [Rhodocyclaceae bacterium]|nr:MFS transporter [Rhodocyclaceae bacterium]